MTELIQDAQRGSNSELIEKNLGSKPAKMSNCNMTYVGIFKEVFEEDRYRVKDYKNLDKKVTEAIRQNHKNFNPSIFVKLDDLKDLGLDDLELESSPHFGVRMSKLHSNGSSYDTEVVSQGLRDIPDLENLEAGDYVCLLNTEKGLSGDKTPNKYQLVKFESEDEMRQAAEHYNLMDKMRLSIVQDYNSALRQNDAYTPAFIEIKEDQASIDLNKLNLVNFLMSIQSQEGRNTVPSPSIEDYDAFKLAVKDCVSDEVCKNDGAKLVSVLINTLSDYGVSSSVTDRLKGLGGEPAPNSIFSEFTKTYPNIGVIDNVSSKQVHREASQPVGVTKNPTAQKLTKTELSGKEQQKTDNPKNDEDELVQAVEIPPIMQPLASLMNTPQMTNQVGSSPAMPFGYPQRQSSGFSLNFGGSNPSDAKDTSQLYRKIGKLMLEGAKVTAARIKDIPFDDIKESIKLGAVGLAESVKEVFDAGAWLLTKDVQQKQATKESNIDNAPFLSAEQKDTFFSTMEKNGLFLENLNDHKSIDRLEGQYLNHEKENVANTLKAIEDDKQMRPANKAQALLSEQDIADNVLKKHKENGFDDFKDKAIQSLKELQKHVQESLKVVVDFINNLLNRSRDGSGPSPS